MRISDWSSDVCSSDLFRIHDGQATLAARFVDTPKRRTDIAANAVVTPGFGTKEKPGARVENNDDATAANISVMPQGAKVWALWEGRSEECRVAKAWDSTCRSWW